MQAMSPTPQATLAKVVGEKKVAAAALAKAKGSKTPPGRQSLRLAANGSKPRQEKHKQRDSSSYNQDLGEDHDAK
jgi:hypothetical protein